MEISTLENWLWDAACAIRGPLDAPKFKDYILPLLFFKRLSDVYEDELKSFAEKLGDEKMARAVAEEDRSVVRFYIPNGHTWDKVRASGIDLGERLTDAMRAVARENPRLQGVIDRHDFNATEAGQRVLDDGTLATLVEILNKHRLGLHDVEPDMLGRAYEYLLRKFAEGSGQSAGEFFTPREVGLLMARILDPEPGQTIYDPCCGSSGLLIKAQIRLREKIAKELGKAPSELTPADVPRPLKLLGQEINPDTYAMSKMNAFIHDMRADIQLGNTMTNPRFKTAEGGLRQVDVVTANPMWNQKYSADIYETDTFNRFNLGTPPRSSADWGWIQHMAAHLKPGGKMAVVLDTGAISRGSGNTGSNKERDVRKTFVEADRVACVILLPENMFYNTNAPGIVLVMTGEGERAHPGEILLVNASQLFAKGRPKNYITEAHIEQIADLVQGWREKENISAIITKDEVVRSDYNLTPSRYVGATGEEPSLPLEEALVLLAEVEEERAEADAELDRVLSALGFEEWRSG